MDEPSPPPRIFIACAPQDMKYRELIADKARYDRLPLVFDSFAEGRVDDINWQRECRRRIGGSRAILMLMSSHSRESARVLWQVGCAREEGISIVVVPVSAGGVDDHGTGEVVGAISVEGWNWKGISTVLLGLMAAPGPRDNRAAAFSSGTLRPRLEGSGGASSRSTAA